MDYYNFDCVDIYTIYQRYCDIMSAQRLGCQTEGHTEDAASPNDKISRNALVELLKVADSRHQSRNFIFDEVFKLMSQLELVADFSKFSLFYDFVFFICRENGQKNITVSRAITAWRIVLAGRFRLLHQWCDFVEQNQRHNISEDTWKQVLAFSRCVHENLEGYDPEGAWPILIDDFVEHMHSQYGFNKKLSFSEIPPFGFDDPLPGLKILPGLKRKFLADFENHNLSGGDCKSPHATITLSMVEAKRNKHTVDSDKYMATAEISSGAAFHACAGYSKQNNSLTPSKSLCAVEGCLSKGLAELLSDRCGLQLSQERRVS